MYLANLHVTVGLMTGKTLLPLPPKETSSDRNQANNKDRVHVLEASGVEERAYAWECLRRELPVDMREVEPDVG